MWAKSGRVVAAAYLHHITQIVNRWKQIYWSVSSAESRYLLFFRLAVTPRERPHFKPTVLEEPRMGPIPQSTGGIFLIIIRLLGISQIFDFFP